MALTLKAKGETEFVLLERGVYTFELTKVRDPQTGPDPFNEGQERTSVALEWTIRDDSENEGEMVLNFYNCTLGTATYPSKLRPFVEALLRRDLDDDEEVTMEDLEGRRIQATLTHKARKAGGFKMVLESPIPVKKKTKTAKPEPTPEPEADDDDVF